MGTHVKVDNKVIERDQNRYRKVYRYIRKKPFPLVCDDGTQISNFTWGAYFVEFKHEHEVVHHFPCCYDAAPAVIATAVGKTEPTASGRAKVSYLTFGEDVTTAGYSPADTTIGTINASKKAELEKEWIDLKNADNSIYRVNFTDGVSPDNSGHALRPGYTPNHTVTVNLSDVSHYGTGTSTSYSGGTSAAVTFEFKQGGGPVSYVQLGDNLTTNLGGNALSVYLQNLWWDFRNSDGTVWRIKISGGGNFPEDHAARTNPSERSVVSRSPDRLFDINPSGSTLGDWITSFKSLLESTTVSGQKFSDKWGVTSVAGTAGSVGAKITFTAKTGNKGTLSNLTNPVPTNPSWYDSYNKGKDDTNDIDIIAHQVAATNPTGTETSTTSKGLITKIIDTINGDSTFSSKWTASSSTNTIERIFGSNHYETFVLTFTASESNAGLISNITDPGAGGNPNAFYYDYSRYGAINIHGAPLAAHFFNLNQASQYRNEKYPDNNQNPPNPVPVLTANGNMSGNSLVSNPNFNVFVTDRLPSGCTFRTSGYYTGYVHYQAIKDGVYTMPDIGRTMEVKTLSFTKTNTQTYNFTVNDNAGFTCLPIVTATADHDVNVFITEITKTSVTVEVSQANYTGNVFIQAIEKGC